MEPNSEKFERMVERYLSDILGKIGDWHRKRQSLLDKKQFYENGNNYSTPFIKKCLRNNDFSEIDTLIKECDGEINKRFEKIGKCMMYGYFPLLGIRSVRNIIYYSSENHAKIVNMFCEYYDLSNFDTYFFDERLRDSNLCNISMLIVELSKDKHHGSGISYEQSLVLACKNKDIQMAKFILSDPRLQKIPMDALKSACEQEDFTILNFFLESPKLQHIDDLTYKHVSKKGSSYAKSAMSIEYDKRNGLCY